MGISLLLLATSAPPVGVEPTPLLSWDGSVPINLVIDANSHYADWVYSPIERVGALASLVTASGATVTNLAVPGQSWSDMRLNAATTDAAWVAGKKNVLVCGETTNSIFGGTSGAPVRTTRDQVISDAQQFIAGRLARNPWLVALCGTIPRGGRPEDAEKNALAQASDDYKAANFRDMGAHAYCDFRADPWFDNDGTSINSTNVWMGVPNLSVESTPEYIHPMGAARGAFAGRIATALQTLPVI